MYGEMVNVRARAKALRVIADELSGRARSLAHECGAMRWRSPAGDVFRSQLHALAGEMGAHANALNDAAQALERHAAAVDETKHAIQDAQAWVTARLRDAVRTVRDAGEAGAGAVEQAIASASASAPAPGSSDWLDFRRLFGKRGWA